MNRATTINAKRFTACFLLLVFLFIHLGKALHSHQHSGHHFTTQAAHELKQSADCPLCEFQCFKDFDGNFLSFLASMPMMFPFLCSNLQHFHTASIGLVYADRGPPAPSC